MANYYLREKCDDFKTQTCLRQQTIDSQKRSPPSAAVSADSFPGSPEVISVGCICAATDNAHGLGHRDMAGRRWWYIDTICPVHGV